MKIKLWIKHRVFISFSIFIIITVNIFTYFLYFFVSENIKTNINKSIINKYETIKTFIDLQSSNIFLLPKYEIEKLNKMGLYFYIWNNDKNLQKEYKIWFQSNSKQIIFRWDYKWFNIIIWKRTNDLENFKKSFNEINIILNIILILWVFIISYFLTYTSLKPLLKLSDFLNNYKNDNIKLKNNYWETEIWILTKSINKFIENNHNILESQKSFIQDTSHELKTPLMQIESNIELIENKIKDENIKKRLKSIKESSENINTIITNLGFILKWEDIPKNKEKINLYNYFQNLIYKYDSETKQKNIKIKIIKNYDLILNNNAYYLDRLFWNILTNSIAYNQWNNNIIIIINKDNIKIIDEWIGIEKSEITKIFDRFYRNKNSWLYYKNWNWLWLVIVKKICDMFWWKIEINSKVWKWSEFIVKIK